MQLTFRMKTSSWYTALYILYYKCHFYVLRVHHVINTTLNVYSTKGFLTPAMQCFVIRCVCFNQVSTETSIDFRITKDGKDYALIISPLNEPIESASYKKKENRVDIILKKKDAISWHELRKK